MSSVTSQTKLPFSAHLYNTSALGFLPRTYGFLKPEMPATSTLVSTTPRDFCFLAFRDNGNLRRSSFLTVGANCLHDFLVRAFADRVRPLRRRLQKLLLPAPPLA